MAVSVTFDDFVTVEVDGKALRIKPDDVKAVVDLLEPIRIRIAQAKFWKRGFLVGQEVRVKDRHGRGIFIGLDGLSARIAPTAGSPLGIYIREIPLDDVEPA